MTSPARVPQQDRSRDTRRKVLQSAIQCLAEYGWHGSTMTVVANRVGISRGALQHHFPTRVDLMIAALEDVAAQREAAAVWDEDKIPPGVERTDYVVDSLINYYTTDLFKAALQVWTAAATEPSLRELIAPMETKFARAAHKKAVVFLNADESDERTRRLIQATLDMARGLGLADLLSDDSERRAKIAHFWKDELATIKVLD